jgi:hypothetical protein
MSGNIRWASELYWCHSTGGMTMKFFGDLFGRSGDEQKDDVVKTSPRDNDREHLSSPSEVMQRLVESGAVSCACMIHPEVIERSLLAKELVRRKLFSVESPHNQLFLPTSVELSRKTGAPLYADRSEPLIKHMVEMLDHFGSQDFEGQTLFQAILSDNPRALKQGQKLIEDLRDFTSMKLQSRQLFLNPEDPQRPANKQ